MGTDRLPYLPFAKRYLLLCLSSLFLLAEPGCGQLWGVYSMGDPENCVHTPNICPGGQHCNVMTEACEPADLTPVDPFPPPTAPTTFISPGGLASTLSFPRPVTYTLAAPKPAMVHFTLDGTPPVPGNASTISVANRTVVGVLPAATTLTFFGDYGAGYNMETPRTFTANVDATAPTTAGVISEDIQFGNGTGSVVTYNLGPVVTVGRGVRLSVRISFQVWAASSGAREQYVVSGAGLGVIGCIDNVQVYGPYPGTSLILFVTFNTPIIPGRYPLVAGVTAQPFCNKTAAQGPEIGQILVQ